MPDQNRRAGAGAGSVQLNACLFPMMGEMQAEELVGKD